MTYLSNTADVANQREIAPRLKRATAAVPKKGKRVKHKEFDPHSQCARLPLPNIQQT
jgi:hypothetical protein